MRVAMIGASGLIGSHMLPHLEQFALLSLGRRAVLPEHEGWEEKIAPMEQWPSLLEGERVDAAIAAIGTTRAKTPDWDAYEAIDRHAVVDFARAAKAAGARQLIVISSAMADADSNNRYLAIKGKMEADVQALGFRRLDIVRPGLLRGERGGERRIGERIGILLSPLVNLFLQGGLDKYQAIDAALVARVAARLLSWSKPGTSIHHNREIRMRANRRERMTA